MHKAIEKTGWGMLATFVPNKKIPVYNWYYYKEGFSRELVMKILDLFSPSGTVLDPFCGVGTTLVACRERGIDSIGFDVSPLCVLASRAKTNSYDLYELGEGIKFISGLKFKKPDTGWIPERFRRFFKKETLEDVIFYRNSLEGFAQPVRDFLLLGLINAANKASWMYKDGAVLKIRKKPVPQFRRFYLRILKKMLRDLKKTEFRQCETIVEEGDARKMKLNDESVDDVITSPPYLNKIEYTKIYSVEEFLFFGKPEERGLRSFIGLDAKNNISEIFPETRMPDIARAYFLDMKRVFDELYRVCRPGSRIAMIVGDGCFPTGVVRSTKLLPELAEQAGLEAKKTYVLNRRTCTRERVIKLGKMDESLLIMLRP